MRKIWLLLAVAGTVIPFYYVIPFFMEHGMNMPLFFEFLLANSVSQFFAIDLVISSIAFLLWSYLDSKKNRVEGWWVVLVTNLCVGLSLALPLYFYKRHASPK